jgi:hypothetical protein
MPLRPSLIERGYGIMDKYELFIKNLGIEISREDYEAGISFKSGKMEGHPALIKLASEAMWKAFGPLFRELGLKKSQFPSLLAELSYSDKETTINLLRLWLEYKTPVTMLYDKIFKEVIKYDHKHESFLKKCSEPPQPFEFISSSPEERFDEMFAYCKSTFDINEKFKQNLRELTYSNPKEAIRILRYWGQGKKAAPQLWEAAEKALALQ